MTTSDQIDQLAAALAAAQGAMRNPTRDREVTVRMKSGGAYTFAYATLGEIMDVVRGPLASNGLAIIQTVAIVEDVVTVTTRLAHASGQWVESSLPLRVSEPSPQAIGSAITYARRYSLTSLLALAADEDDDANAAAGNHVSPGLQPRRGGSESPRPAAVPQPTEWVDAYERAVSGAKTIDDLAAAYREAKRCHSASTPDVQRETLPRLLAIKERASVREQEMRLDLSSRRQSEIDKLIEKHGHERYVTACDALGLTESCDQWSAEQLTKLAARLEEPW